VNATTGVQGITENDIANYLANTPGFFERHAELLASVQITSPHGQRAVSLQERQMEMLRERIKGLERKIIEMLRHGQENLSLVDRLHRWTLVLLLTPADADLPQGVVDELRHEFLIPQAALRIWDADAVHADAPFAQPVSDDARSLASSLAQPYCGANSGFEAVSWLDEPAAVASLALIPLRQGVEAPAFGLLVLGSPDPTRYQADMGTEFLVRVGELASAALARLLPARA
jgi:uncharacterized protein YigA (DUF484 family)